MPRHRESLCVLVSGERLEACDPARGGPRGPWGGVIEPSFAHLKVVQAGCWGLREPGRGRPPSLRDRGRKEHVS